MTEFSQPRRNIELKARCRDLPAVRRAVSNLPVRDGGVQQQIDTYFAVSKGRLKLRQIIGVGAELIWYDRTDEAKSRKSEYRIAVVSHPAELKAALAAALGVRGEVSKRREILLWHNVRIHLDDVERLGTFVEFEAVMSEGEDEATGHERLAELCRALSISQADYLRESYADLILDRG